MLVFHVMFPPDVWHTFGATADIPDSHGMFSISGGMVPNELAAWRLGWVVGLSELSDTTSSQHWLEQAPCVSTSISGLPPPKSFCIIKLPIFLNGNSSFPSDWMSLCSCKETISKSWRANRGFGIYGWELSSAWTLLRKSFTVVQRSATSLL